MDNNILPKSEFLLYTSPEGDIKIEVFLNDETVWLTINKMAELFNTSKQNISYHLQNIYNEGELAQKSTVKEILTVQNDAYIARKYWNKLAQRLREEGSEVVTKCHRLKFMANDGKYYLSRG